MDINKVYDFLKYLADKDQSGNITPKEFNLSIDRAFSEWTMKRYNNLKDNTQNKTGWQKNQKVKDDLKFLFVRKHVSTMCGDGGGVCGHGETVVVPRQVDISIDNEISSFLGSSIYAKRIKAKKYVIAAFYKDHIQIYPKNIGVVDFTYLRQPVSPYWAFTLENGRPVYDAANSVDLEAPDEVVNEIIMMCASYLGINLREPQLIQYAEQMKQQGV